MSHTKTFIAYESLLQGAERVVVEKDAEGTVTGYVLRQARLLGLESKNDRRYNLPDPRLYEGVKVNIDHPDWMSPNKSQNDKAGFVRSGTIKAVEGRGIYGDVVLNPHHPNAEQHVWDAIHDPNNQGFSHVARTERSDVGEAADGIPILNVLEVISVDLVGRPATTNGLFEQETAVNEKELREEVARLKAANADLEKRLGVAEQTLQTEKDSHAAAIRGIEREAMLAEAKLTDVKPSFRKAVLNAETKAEAAELIATVKGNAPAATPVSGEQAEAVKPDAKTKVESYEDLADVLDYRKGA